VVHSPANTVGYLNNPEASSRLFWEKGWIRTGDIGKTDEDGNLYIIGREKNIIIQAGQTVSPREIEEILDEVPHVRRSAALGVDRGRLEGEQVFIFAEVQGLKGKDGEEFRELQTAIVQAFFRHFGFRPGRVLLVRPGAIPRTDSGKVRYPYLRDLYSTGALERSGHLLYPYQTSGPAR
jgi:long-chain acyl-CoA synthetase